MCEPESLDNPHKKIREILLLCSGSGNDKQSLVVGNIFMYIHKN